jgi:hypothetical protein
MANGINATVEVPGDCESVAQDAADDVAFDTECLFID